VSFAWPTAWLAALAIPLVLGIAALAKRRRRRAAVTVSSAVLVRAALPGRTAWHRRIPAVLLLTALAVLSVAAARPQSVRALSRNSTMIMLTLDVSGSMCSTDVAPNRITAAEQAAAKFINDQPSGTTMGLVTFAGVAGLLVPPTTDKGKLLDALKGLTTSRGTAIGQAILAALDAIAQVDPSVPPTGADVPTGKDVPPAADAIVVLTDGANNRGVDPQTAAEQAAARGVRVYTIGFGTTNPAPLVCSSGQAGGGFGGFGGFGGGGGNFGNFRGPNDRNPLVIDEQALQQVADTTHGQYFRAVNADQLGAALAELPSTLVTIRKKTDLAAWFAALGGLLAVGAVGLSLWWNRPRVPKSLMRTG
jgi:Ca-activated chloride channel family protein